MNKKEFIKKYDFVKRDNFCMTKYPEIKECYSKDLFISKGDHSDDLQSIDLIIFADGSKYLCFASSLADALFDQEGSDLMINILKVVNLLADCGYRIEDDNKYSEYVKYSYDLDKYYFCCSTISKRINKYEDADINGFIRASSIFQSLAEIIWETDDLSFIEKYLETFR